MPDKTKKTKANAKKAKQTKERRRRRDLFERVYDGGARKRDARKLDTSNTVQPEDVSGVAQDASDGDGKRKPVKIGAWRMLMSWLPFDVYDDGAPRKKRIYRFTRGAKKVLAGVGIATVAVVCACVVAVNVWQAAYDADQAAKEAEERGDTITADDAYAGITSAQKATLEVNGAFDGFLAIDGVEAAKVYDGYIEDGDAKVLAARGQLDADGFYAPETEEDETDGNTEEDASGDGSADGGVSSSSSYPYQHAGQFDALIYGALEANGTLDGSDEKGNNGTEDVDAASGNSNTNSE